MIARQHPHVTLVGVDPSPKMLEVGQKKLDADKLLAQYERDRTIELQVVHQIDGRHRPVAQRPDELVALGDTGRGAHPPSPWLSPPGPW